MNLYRSFDVWEQHDERTAIRYRCFEILETGKFFVQSADYYHFPLRQEHIAHHEAQFVEVFLERDEDDPETKSFLTIEAAIAHLKLPFEFDEEDAAQGTRPDRTDDDRVH